VLILVITKVGCHEDYRFWVYVIIADDAMVDAYLGVIRFVLGGDFRAAHMLSYIDNFDKL